MNNGSGEDTDDFDRRSCSPYNTSKSLRKLFLISTGLPLLIVVTVSTSDTLLSDVELANNRIGKESKVRFNLF